MYKKSIPYKDFNDTPRNGVIHLNLMETEVFKLMREFQLIDNWRRNIQSEETVDLDSGEVIEFYTALEEILLSAYGKPVDDGQRFDKSDKYKFADSALFNATMMLFVTDPAEATKMIDELMPKGLLDLVQKADANLAAMAKEQGNDSDLRRQLDEVRAQLAETQAALPAGPTSPTT